LFLLLPSAVLLFQCHTLRCFPPTRYLELRLSLVPTTPLASGDIFQHRVLLLLFQHHVLPCLTTKLCFLPPLAFCGHLYHMILVNIVSYQ
jgi:hypothetical protein